MTDELKDLSALHKQLAGMVAERMAAIAPRDSGELAGSIRASGTRTAARARSRLIYAPIIHYGWPERGIEAQPFGDQARASLAGQISSTYEAGIAKIVDKAGR
jgi:hypothetical protein